MEGAGRWSVVHSFEDGLLCKRHGLQGPIDDAFMDSFMLVAPTGQAWNESIGRWTTNEMAKAVAEWRNQFRGEPQVKRDDEVTDADAAANNLIPLGRSAQQQFDPENCGQTTVCLGREDGAHWEKEFRFNTPSAGVDLSESPAPKAIRGLEQRLHLRAFAFVQQRGPDPEAARLRGRGHRRSACNRCEWRGRRGGILRRAVEITA